MDNRIEASNAEGLISLPVIFVTHEDSDGNNVVCPHDRYFDYRSGFCVKFPFDEMPIIYMTMQETKNESASDSHIPNHFIILSNNL